MLPGNGGRRTCREPWTSIPTGGSRSVTPTGNQCCSRTCPHTRGCGRSRRRWPRACAGNPGDPVALGPGSPGTWRGRPAWMAGRPRAYLASDQIGPAQIPAPSGLAMTGLVLVPANRATLGTPYSASFPKVWKVLGMTLPKFHAHEVICDPSAEDCRLSDQNG